MALTEIINFMQDLAEEEQMQVCVKGSMLGGLLVGGGACAMSLLFGPIGLLIGGAGAGALSALLMKGKYVSAVEIIRNMNEEKRERLGGRVRNIMRNVNATDVAGLIGMAAGNATLRNQLIQEMVGQFREMNLQIQGF